MNKSATMETTCMSCFADLESSYGICPACGYNEAVQVTSPHQLHPRTILNGKYLLGKVLGESDSDITYIAWDLKLDIKVAIKEYYPKGIVTRDGTTTVSPDTGEKAQAFASGRDRFLQEAKNLAELYPLPGNISVKDSFTENGTAYIVREFNAEVLGETDHDYIPVSPSSSPEVTPEVAPEVSSEVSLEVSPEVRQQVNVATSTQGYTASPVSAYPPQQSGVGSASAYPPQQPGVGFVPAYPPQQAAVGPVSAYSPQQPVSNRPTSPSPKWSTQNKVTVSICACVIVLVCLGGLIVFLLNIGRGGKDDDRSVLSTDTQTEENTKPETSTKPETNTQPETSSTSEEPQTITIAGETISVDVTELDLNDKNIDDISVLAELTNLESLDISFNYISDISALSTLTNLKSLDISNTDIIDISALAGLTNLEKLSCNFTEVSDIQALKNLTNLTSLEIYYNNISDISALAGLTNLTNLDVDSNNISDISVLAGLTMLDYLNLNNNPLTQNQVDELQDALPYCYIAATGLTASVPVAVDLTNDEIFAILEDQVYNEEIKEIVPDITYTLDSGMKIQLLEYARVSYDDEYDAVVYRINVSCVSGQAALEENDFMLLHDLDGTQETPYLDAPYVVGDMLTEEGLTFPIALSQEPKELAIGFLIPSAATDAAFVCTNILNGTSAGPMYLYVTFDAIE